MVYRFAKGGKKNEKRRVICDLLVWKAFNKPKIKRSKKRWVVRDQQ